MKKIVYWPIFLLILVSFTFKAQAAEKKLASPSPAVMEATPSAEIATPSAIVETVVEKKPTITEPTPGVTGKLEKYLIDHPLKPLTITNFLQHAIRLAVRRGVPANTLVVVLLFPLVASLIAASRHIVGIRGFGIFLPAVLSVVFVATGIVEGLLLFFTIIVVVTGAKFVLKWFKLQYLPRMALLLWFVSMGVLLVLIVSPFINLKTIITLSIFPILILILLAENFMDIQVGMSMREAVSMTLETVAMALICSLILNLEFLQRFVLLNPEITVLAVAVLDIAMGKYVGLRWLEYKKFKEIIK